MPHTQNKNLAIDFMYYFYYPRNNEIPLMFGKYNRTLTCHQLSVLPCNKFTGISGLEL